MIKRISNELLINAILTTHTQKEASKLLGVSEQTISKRMKEDSFKKELTKRRREITLITSTKLVQANEKALSVLISLLDSNSESIRYNASTKILALSNEYIDTQDILTRLEEIENNISNKANSEGEFNLV